MKTIIFKNNGIIDLDFIRSFGVSVKENDNPIGFFGTGLKYAIAILLREKQEVSVFLGKEEYKFSCGEVGERIASAWLGCKEKDLIRIALTAAENNFEKKLNYCDRPEIPTAEFIEVVEEIVSDGIANINASALKKCRDLSDRLKPTPCSLSIVQKAQLDKSLHILDRMGYQINKYPVMVVEDLGNLCMGLAKDNTIYIAKRCFHMGTKQVVATIFEEYLHLRHKLKDNTYEMQNFLFDIIFTNAENYILQEAI